MSNSTQRLDEEIQHAIREKEYYQTLSDSEMVKMIEQRLLLLTQERMQQQQIQLLLLQQQQQQSPQFGVSHKQVDPTIRHWWKILCHAQTYLNPTTRVLTFSEPCIPFGCSKQMKQIYVRPSYTDMESFACEAFNDECGFLITGNPGVGKSVFAHYFLYQLIRNDPEWESIVFEHKCLNQALHIRRKRGVHVAQSELFYDDIQTCTATGDRKNYYIFDAAGPETHPSKRVAKSLVLASPNLRCYKYWEKDAAERRYMPTWSWDEILELWQMSYATSFSQNILESRYSQVGGIPRYIFHRQFNEKVLPKLHHAIEKIDMTGLIRCAGTFDAMHDVLSHMVFQYHLNSQYDMVEFMPGTRYIQELLWRKLKQHDGSGIVQFLREAAGITTLATTRGKILEKVVHSYLQYDSTQWSCRAVAEYVENVNGARFQNLNNSNNNNNTFVVPHTLNLPMMKIQHFRHFKDVNAVSQIESTLWIPWSDNFPTIDSLYIDKAAQTIYAFQVTVSDTHKVEISILKHMMQELSLMKLILVNMVPCDVYSAFKCKLVKGKHLLPPYDLYIPILVAKVDLQNHLPIFSDVD